MRLLGLLLAVSVESLLAHHQAFAGWSSGAAALDSWRAQGIRTAGGAQDRFTEFRRGLVFHDTLTSAGATDEIGFSGRYVWRADENHFWRVVMERPAQSAIAFDIVRDEAIAPFHPVVAGNATVDGHACAMLRLQPAGLVPIEIYEDLTSGAFRKVVVAPGSADSRSFNNIGYKRLENRANVIATWRSENAEYSVRSFDRMPVADSDLQPQTSAASWTYGSGAVPLLFATVKSQTLRDTGVIAGHDISSQAAVTFAGVGATGDPITTSGLGITYTAWNSAATSGTCIAASRISVGPYRYENPPICFGGVNVFGSNGGLIGMDFLRHFNWTIDYAHSRFTLIPNNQ